jgi:DNA-binding NarL/FixJ family response regulator
MIRVLIVDDHPIVREGIATVLARESDIRVVGFADGMEQGLRLAAERSPDVVLLDLRLPDVAESESVQRFAAASRRLVVFTANDADDVVLRAIRDGARGYLLKGSPAAEIVEAIRVVHAGGSYLSPRIATTLVSDAARPRGRTTLLSARERGVLRLVAAGLSNREIGQALAISERTVKFHVTSILNKLGADNRAQAVALAARRGLLSDASG